MSLWTFQGLIMVAAILLPHLKKMNQFWLNMGSLGHLGPQDSLSC